MGTVAYLIGKIRDKTEEKTENNVRYAARVAAYLWSIGVYLVVPQLNSYHNFLGYGNFLSWNDYLCGDEEIIMRVDCCIVLDNYHTSEGSKREIAFAEKNGKKIYYWPNYPKEDKL